MTGGEGDRRDSRALEPQLITDLQEKAAAEARNGFRQYDAAISAIHTALERGSFKLRPSLILGLQREALAGISSYAGNYRPGGVAIEGSKHEPVGAHLVPELVEDMCDYVNDHWDESTPISSPNSTNLLAGSSRNLLRRIYLVSWVAAAAGYGFA